MVTTAFGQAEVVEEVKLPQRVDGKAWTTHVQLLESRDGDWNVRFAYSTDGAARRGPVTFRGVDLERLRKQLEKKPRLRVRSASASCEATRSRARPRARAPRRPPTRG